MSIKNKLQNMGTTELIGVINAIEEQMKVRPSTTELGVLWEVEEELKNRGEQINDCNLYF